MLSDIELNDIVEFDRSNGLKIIWYFLCRTI